MFHLAKKIAAKSKHKQHHHACIITKGGCILAMGANSVLGHAEMRAAYQLNKEEWKYCTLWSFRWRKNGTFGMARPCHECMKIAVKFKKVYFTNADGKLERL
jgi:deoxycytidylate deaminase